MHLGGYTSYIPVEVTYMLARENDLHSAELQQETLVMRPCSRLLTTMISVVIADNSNRTAALDCETQWVSIIIA